MEEKTQSKIVPRPRQRKAAKALVDNMLLDKPLPEGEVLEMAGYPPTVSQNPGKIKEQRGFKLALAEMGLTEELVVSSLTEDIREKKQNRLGELRLGAEILGINKREDEPDRKPTGNTYNFIFSKEVQDDVKAIEARIKARLINSNVQKD